VQCRHYEIGAQLTCPVPEPDPPIHGSFFMQMPLCFQLVCTTVHCAGIMRLVLSWPALFLSLTHLYGNFMTLSLRPTERFAVFHWRRMHENRFGISNTYPRICSRIQKGFCPSLGPRVNCLMDRGSRVTFSLSYLFYIKIPITNSGFFPEWSYFMVI
jgi:hypothetical protein